MLDWDENNTHASQLLFSGTDAEMYSLINLALAEKDHINSGGYDYNLPIYETLFPNSVWADLNDQNSNSVAVRLAEVMGLKDLAIEFIENNNLNTPGYLSPIEHSFFEKSIDTLFEAMSDSQQSLENIADYLSDYLGIDNDYSFSSSFNSYFEDAFAKENNLNLNLFKITSNITDGEAIFSGSISF